MARRIRRPEGQDISKVSKVGKPGGEEDRSSEGFSRRSEGWKVMKSEGQETNRSEE